MKDRFFFFLWVSYFGLKPGGAMMGTVVKNAIRVGSKWAWNS